MSPLPPGPSAPPIVQTLRWMNRPIAFMETCARRYGDAFTVNFLGFQSPMVMLSDPEAIRALYTERANEPPPSRQITLAPVVGPDSVLVLNGAPHLARRKLMLPPFHGERMRGYEAAVAEITEREIAAWPRDESFAIHPRMQAVTLELILRVVFGVTDSGRREALRRRLPALTGDSASIGTPDADAARAALPARRRDGRAADIDGRDRRAAAGRDRRPPRRPRRRRAARTSSRCWPRPASRTARR